MCHVIGLKYVKLSHTSHKVGKSPIYNHTPMEKVQLQISNNGF